MEKPSSKSVYIVDNIKFKTKLEALAYLEKEYGVIDIHEEDHIDEGIEFDDN